MKTKLIKTLMISAIAVMSLTGCGDKNASMYVVEKQPEVVEEEPEKKESNYAYITAKISDGADKDKNLGKKCIVEIQGQPIAVLLDDYENEFGFKKESEVTEVSDDNNEKSSENKLSIFEVASKIDTTASVDEQLEALNQFLNMFPQTSKIEQESGKKFKDACSNNEINCVNVDLEDNNTVSTYNNISSIMLAVGNVNESVLFMTYSGYDTNEDMESLYKEFTSSEGVEGNKVSDTRYEGIAQDGSITVVVEKFDKCIVVAQYSTDNKEAKTVLESILDTLR